MNYSSKFMPKRFLILVPTMMMGWPSVLSYADTRRYTFTTSTHSMCFLFTNSDPVAALQIILRRYYQFHFALNTHPMTKQL